MLITTSCRKKDTAQSPHYALQQRDVSPTAEELSPEPQESPSRDTFATRDILPQRSPTLLKPWSSQGNGFTPVASSTPQLSFTPASSVNTEAVSYNSFVLSSPHRPLPPRSYPRSSSSGFVNRSIDLVTPIITYNSPSSWASSGRASYSDHSRLATSTKHVSAVQEDVQQSSEDLTESYKKQHNMPARNQFAGQGNLMQLFKFEQMRAPPKT